MIDVIVTNVNRPEETTQTINALLKANDDIRVILVNDSLIGKPEIETTSRITVIDLGKNAGQARAVNIGLEMAKSEYVCFMHNDIVINDKNWVSKAVNFLKKNNQAGLVDVYGWKLVGGKILRITSLKGYGSQKAIEPTHDFEEVSRTDEMANIFKNDGLKADRRYGRTCCGVWIDVLGRGLKLYVIKIKDGEHSPGKDKITEASPGTKLYTKQRKYQKSLRSRIRLLKLKEHGLEFTKIFE